MTAASPPQTDRAVVFARLGQCASRVACMASWAHKSLLLFPSGMSIDSAGSARQHTDTARYSVGSNSPRLALLQGWLGSRVASVLDSGAEWPGFKSQPRRCRVTVLGKLFTPIVPLFTQQRNW